MLRESSSSLILFTNPQREASEKHPSVIHTLHNRARLLLFKCLQVFIMPTPHLTTISLPEFSSMPVSTERAGGMELSRLPTYQNPGKHFMRLPKFETPRHFYYKVFPRCPWRGRGEVHMCLGSHIRAHPEWRARICSGSAAELPWQPPTRTDSQGGGEEKSS